MRGDTSRVAPAPRWCCRATDRPSSSRARSPAWRVIALTHGSYRFGVITSLAGALIALSLVVLTGMVGQISLAQTAFAGLAGLVLAKIGTGVPFPLSLVIAVAIATVVGTLVGLPALRIRGAQLAVVTLAAAVAVEELIFNGPALLASSGSIPSWRLFGIDLSVRAGRDVARWPFAVVRAGGRRRQLRARRQRAARHAPAVACSRCAPTSAPPRRSGSTSASPSSARSPCRRGSPGSAAR